ncbi:MAG TPA: DUF3131 domain-containing protein [Polyangia bacterium]|jgi:hypothetical protein|nr:DUF3131 domain-containing protein [Polyangia bacterium]
MSFWKGLLTARSHIAFLIGLSLALALIWRLEAGAPPAPVGGVEDFAKLLKTTGARAVPLRPTGVPLTPDELAVARTAWRYFERNHHPSTGLVNSVDGYPSTTLWDLGSYLMGLLAAQDLGLIDEPTFTARAEPLLASLARLPLVDGQLPNKAYDARTLQMVDYRGRKTPKGIGWSVIDIARLGVPLDILAWSRPDLTDRVRAILARWRLDRAVADGRLQGALRTANGKLRLVQEGRYGYEQYAAKLLFLLGADTSRALRYDLDIELLPVDGQLVAADRRLPADHGGTHNAVISEPYILEALEFGLTATTLPIARAVYQAQENHARETHRLTAVSEDNIDRPPYFVYNSVINDRQPWAAFTPDGKDAAAHKSLSLKAALGWSYIFAGPYAGQLRAAAATLADPQRGFYSGRYDADGAPNKALTANTNGVVLETLWYHVRGPLLQAARSR